MIGVDVGQFNVNQQKNLKRKKMKIVKWMKRFDKSTLVGCNYNLYNWNFQLLIFKLTFTKKRNTELCGRLLRVNSQQTTLNVMNNIM